MLPKSDRAGKTNFEHSSVLKYPLKRGKEENGLCGSKAMACHGHSLLCVRKNPKLIDSDIASLFDINKSLPAQGIC